MSMTNQQQLTQIKDKCLDSLNRVNLLLLKQHDLRRDQKLYTQQLTLVQQLIQSLITGRNNGINIIAQDTYLRELLRQNQKQLQKLQQKLKGQDLLCNEVNQLKKTQQKYLDMISNQFQNTIQQRLSTIRGKVDQMKKKIKEINKETLSYEQEHLEGIDQYSLGLKLLEDYQKQNIQLREKIGQLKAMQKK